MGYLIDLAMASDRCSARSNSADDGDTVAIRAALRYEMDIYAQRNGFSEQDLREALTIAARNPLRWLEYIRAQNAACR
jgi:hypothetical protein